MELISGVFSHHRAWGRGGSRARTALMTAKQENEPNCKGADSSVVS